MQASSANGITSSSNANRDVCAYKLKTQITELPRIQSRIKAVDHLLLKAREGAIRRQPRISLVPQFSPL
jgi:hypothetical protein